jgi:glycosyltransferase involved in cell wall biosynthesis
MLSIIICSRTQNISKNLSENIKNTVGYQYELIVIDNSETTYSIFEAYNLGIDKSKGEFLCFIHDDILFHTNAWGNVLHNLFNSNQQLGLIGVAGAKFKSKIPSAWWDSTEDQRVINIIQNFSNKNKEKWSFGFENGKNTEVVAIDGVFMAMRKEKFIRFDSKMKGFHNYDLNISFEWKKKGLIIMVTNEILIEHFSLGILNEAWVHSTYIMHKRYKNILPLGKSEKLIIKKVEVNNAERFIAESFKYNLIMIAISVWVQLFRLNPISKYHFRFWKRIIKEKLCSPL